MAPRRSFPAPPSPSSDRRAALLLALGNGSRAELCRRICAQVPADGFAVSVQRLWDEVVQNKDLDLPAHHVMVATVRCAEIAAQQARARIRI